LQSAVCGKSFAALDAEQQDQVLGGLEKDEIKLKGASGKEFFETILQNTMEVFLPTRSTAAIATWRNGSSSNDAEVASVLTYIRNSWGNAASAVSPDQVSAARGSLVSSGN
jgi:hypothetical protein